MKKSIIAIFTLLMVMSAVNLSAQTNFGIKGSFNMFNMAMQDEDGDKIEASMIPTFDAGVFVEIPVADEFYLRPELLFAQKGSKSDILVETTTRMSYLELPINFLYKGPLSGGNVLVGFGPYVAMGIGGKVEAGNVSMDIKYEKDYTDVDELAVYYKPFDMGAKVMAGFEMAAGLQVALNASLGIANILPEFNGNKPDESVKHMGFGLSLGYAF